jgi:hypothetical protein
MALIDMFGKGFLEYLGGPGRAILGDRNPKFTYGTQYMPMQQVIVPFDYSFGQLMRVAQNVPHLNIAISKGAEMFSNVIIEHVDRNGEVIEDSDVIALLNRPNPLQSFEQWAYEYYIYNAIYNTNLIYKNYGTPSRIIEPLPSIIWNLPVGMIEIKLTGKLYDQTTREGIIEGYKLMYQERVFTAEEVIHVTEGISANGGISATTRIEGLQMALSNIVAIMKTLNIITTERGLIGFISADGSTSDTDGALPFDTEERERAEADYKKNYGVDGKNGHVTFTSAKIKWTPMTFDVKQLMLHEGLEDSFNQILGAYGLDRRIFPKSILANGALTEGSGVIDGLKATYQNTMQPFADKCCGQLTKDFRLRERPDGGYLRARFDLPCMKDDELKEAQADLAFTQRNQILYQSNLIDAQSWADEEEIKLTGGATKYEPPVVNPNPSFGGNK